jgi:hypothetical protein
MSVAWHPEEVSKLLVGEKNGVIHIFNIVSYHVIPNDFRFSVRDLTRRS